MLFRCTPDRALKKRSLWPASRWLIVLALASGIAGPIAAEGRTEASQRAVTQFQQAQDALDREAVASDFQVRRVAARAGALLTAHGIKWNNAPDDAGIIVIAPVRGASRLNDLAFGLSRDVAGLALVYDPRALKVENAAALYDEDAHRLVLSHQEITTGTVTDYVAHEIVHARNFHALTRGLDNIFLGWISRREAATPFHDTYPDVFSIDELQAYAHQARVNLRELDRRSRHADVEGTIEMLDSGARLALATFAASKAALAQIAAVIAAGPERQGFSEKRTIDQQVVQLTGFETATGRVYFYPWQLPSRVAKPAAVMRAVAQSSDFEVDLFLAKGFDPASADAELTTFLARTRSLLDRAEAMAASFLELKLLVAEGSYGKAWDRSRALRVLSRRN
jgi:hypothetical protein